MFSAPAPRLQLQREERRRLLWALGLSVVIHFLLFGTWQLNKRYHFLEQIQLPSWLFPPKRLAERMVVPPGQTPQQQQPPVLEIMPQQFVEVNPASATAEPPKDAKYYSTANSVAANPTADKETTVPKIDGSQTDFVKTETVTIPTAKPLNPTPPMTKPVPKAEVTSATPAPPVENAQPSTKAEEELRPKATPEPGDLAIAKANDTPRTGNGQASRSRPRTFKEAVARLAARDPAAASGLVGERVRQEGGVKNRDVTSSLDVRSSPFGAYDAAIIYAVQNRWYGLLDAKSYANEVNGKVNIEFRLHQDGRVTNLKVNDASVDDIYSIICQRAILDNSPYEKWPPDMRRMIHEDYRDVTFTFYYH